MHRIPRDNLVASPRDSGWGVEKHSVKILIEFTNANLILGDLDFITKQAISFVIME